jgi:hypothetical protein
MEFSASEIQKSWLLAVTFEFAPTQVSSGEQRMRQNCCFASRVGLHSTRPSRF